MRCLKMKQNVVKELNTFLEGNFMGIEAYEKFIQHIQNDEIKEVLQIIQQNHKKHTIVIARRIQDLGGVPVKDVGMMGNVAELMNKVKGPTKGDLSIVEDALTGEQRGIVKSKELLAGDLDKDSLEMVNHILNADEKHIDLLAKFAK